MGHWFPFQAVSDFRVAYLDEGLVVSHLDLFFLPVGPCDFLGRHNMNLIQANYLTFGTCFYRVMTIWRLSELWL